MPSPPFIASDPYLDYSDQIRRLHRLIRRGRGDSGAAEATREAMDASWRLLTADEVARMRALSADLNTIGATPPASADPDAIRARLRDLERAGDWTGILALLREHPAGLLPAEAAYTRGRCWSALGEVAAAAEFYEEAVRIDPLDERPALALMLALGALGQFRRRSRVVLWLSGCGNPAIPPQLVEMVHAEGRAREDYRAASQALRDARRELRRLRRASREARRRLLARLAAAPRS